MLCILPGTVSMAGGGQCAVDRKQSQVGDVVRVLDGTSTSADDTRSVISIQLISPALYTLRPVAAFPVHLFKLTQPLSNLRIITTPYI